MENYNLIRKIAWSFHQSTGLDWDDLVQEAYIAYIYAKEHYDPNKKISLATFVWIHMTNHLKTYYQKEKDFVRPLDKAYSLEKKKIAALESWVPSYHPIDYDTFFDSFTDDMLEITNVILYTSAKFVKLDTNGACRRIRNIMLNRGWSEERITYNLDNIKAVCSK